MWCSDFSSNFPALFTFSSTFSFPGPFICLYLFFLSYFHPLLSSYGFHLFIFFISIFSFIFIPLVLLFDILHDSSSSELGVKSLLRYSLPLLVTSIFFSLPSLDLPILPYSQLVFPLTPFFLSRSISRRDCSRSRAIVKPNSSSARWICGHHCGPKLGGSGLLKILLHISNLILQIILTLNALASTLFSPS